MPLPVDIAALPAGTPISMFWYVSDLTDFADPFAAWYDGCLVYPPRRVSIDGADVYLALVAETAFHADACGFPIHVEVLCADHYGADPGKGEMWLVGEPKPRGKASKKSIDLAKIERYIRLRNRIVDMFPEKSRIADFLAFFGKGNDKTEKNKDAAIQEMAKAIAQASKQAAAAALQQQAHDDGGAPRLVPAPGGGWRARLEPSRTQLNELHDRIGMKDCGRACSLCVAAAPEGKKRQRTGEASSSGPDRWTKGDYVPIVLLSDVQYMLSSEDETPFRDRSTHEPRIFNGFNLCKVHKDSFSTEGASKAGEWIDIANHSHNCIMCITTCPYDDVSCKGCEEVKNSGAAAMIRLFRLMTAMFPHYDIHINLKPMTVGRTQMDFTLTVRPLGGSACTLFWFECDQNQHAGYGKHAEKRRTVEAMATVLAYDRYDRVVLIRYNHNNAYSMPPEISASGMLHSTVLRHVVLRQWALWFLLNLDSLPPTTMLYLFYNYLEEYAPFKVPSQKEHLYRQEDDITPDTAGEPAVPFFKHPCCGFAYGPPPADEGKPWRYYFTNGEYARCHASESRSGKAPSAARQLGAMAREQAKYRPFVDGLHAKMRPFPSVVKETELKAAGASGSGA